MVQQYAVALRDGESAGIAAVRTFAGELSAGAVQTECAGDRLGAGAHACAHADAGTERFLIWWHGSARQRAGRSICSTVSSWPG